MLSIFISLCLLALRTNPIAAQREIIAEPPYESIGIGTPTIGINPVIIAQLIKKYKKIIEKNFDYVGDNFTEEAKKIKYGEIEERPIYGEANLEQTKELIEEEISFTPLPWSPNKKTN